MSILKSAMRSIRLVSAIFALLTIAIVPVTAAVQSVTSHDLVNTFNSDIQSASGGLLTGLVGVEVATVPVNNVNYMVEEWNDNDATSRQQGDLIPATADFNASGLIDGADFLIWQRNFGTLSGATRADGDATGNGEVDGVDLQQWTVQFGTNGDVFGNGTPTMTIAYDLGGEFDISEINTYSNWGDARTFQTFVVNFSIDNGNSFSPLGYFESDPGGDRDTPNGGNPFLDATKVVITDDGGGLLGTGVTDIRFDIYAASIVTATGSPFTPFVNDLAADPFDGPNPFKSNVDDGLPAATQGTSYQEIDVFGSPTPLIVSSVAGVPEPSTLVGLLIGSLICLGRVGRA